MMFQMMFAVITPALIIGSFAERMRFSSFCIFMLLWATIVYDPIAHWLWGVGGFLKNMGALDFAGGAVVHINAGMTALAAALILGKRQGFPNGISPPHNLPFAAIGAGLLWFGWFGFNAGSALTSGGLASSAFVATNISAAAAGVTWLVLGWVYRRPSALGIATGAIAGLAAVTPAAGFINPLAGVPIGIVASVVGYFCISFRTKRHIDESLDVWAVHGMGGVWGVLATGIFTTAAVNPLGVDGLIFGNAMPMARQVAGIAAVGVFAFVATWILGKIIDLTVGLSVSATEETVGLDISQHGERAYGGLLR
jgi:Amt family ammonium transporter